MISFEEALHLVLAHCPTPTTESILLAEATGRTLAQDVLADQDLPPFDRVTMDGIAVQAEMFQQGIREFTVAGVQAAGAPALSLQDSNHCLEVMTGAVLPGNTNAVVPYEQCEIKDGIATVTASDLRLGHNIHRQGTDATAGDTLVKKGNRITPAVVGILASVGLAEVEVLRPLAIAICSTGDELVDVNQTPLPRQIRKSNVYMLAAELQAENIKTNLFHLPDEPEAMFTALREILESHEVLLLSGAVSKGKFDFLPQVLARLQLNLVFHSIAQKPGKPMLFGTLPGGKTVFGFPGNPVSTFVCYHLYFKPWLQQHQGLPAKKATAVLAESVSFKPNLTYHVPVTLSLENGMLNAWPIHGSGSGDLTSLLPAQGLLSLPSDKVEFLAGERFPVTLFSFAL